MHEPLVSVIIHVHNGAATLALTIALALKHTLQSLEVIVVNEDPTDNKHLVAERYRGDHQGRLSDFSRSRTRKFL